MEHKPLLSTIVRDEHRKQSPKEHLNSLSLFFQSFPILLQAQKGLYFFVEGKLTSPSHFTR